MILGTPYVRGLLRYLVPAQSDCDSVERQVEVMSVRDGYRLWASTYAAETAASALDEQLAQQMLKGLPHTRLLDAGCGIGKRIQTVPNSIGLDLSPEMIAAAKCQNIVLGDVRQMPFGSDEFDMVWCRLVLGHIAAPLLAYRELFRVCAPGGYLYITDFHSDAVRAGHRRTITGEGAKLYALEHYVHRNHIELAMQAGFVPVRRCCGRVGPSIRRFYAEGIGMRRYWWDYGMNIVDAMLFRKPAKCYDIRMTII